MIDIKALQIFIDVIDEGSFSEVARQRNMSTSSIARQLSAVEEEAGVRLLERTTRRHALTPAGEIYSMRVRNVLRGVVELQQEVAAHRDNARGVLRTQIRSSAAHAIIVRALPTFLGRYPDIQIDIDITEGQGDLVSSGTDIAVWQGVLSDSTMMVRQLTTGLRVLCASPSYVATHGIPKTPADLKNHNCLIYGAHGADEWAFSTASGREAIHVAGRVQSRTGSILLDCALNGVGILAAQSWMVGRAFASGALVPILADYRLTINEEETPLFAVYPNSRILSRKARVFIDFLVEVFRDAQQMAAAGSVGGA